jgi:hypothetical protein
MRESPSVKLGNSQKITSANFSKTPFKINVCYKHNFTHNPSKHGQLISTTY